MPETGAVGTCTIIDTLLNNCNNVQATLLPFIIMPRAELLRHTVVVLSVIMPRAELRRHTVVVLSVILSATHISSFAENQALKLATQAEIDI